MPRIGARLVCGVILLASLGLLAQAVGAQYGSASRVHLPLVLGASGQHPPTAVPPTATLRPPTATLVPPTATQLPPTATQVPPTATRVPPTATPVPPTATNVMPTSAPTATVQPTPCNTRVQLVANPSFEQESAWMTLSGIPARSTTTSRTGSYSMLFGGYNNAIDAVTQGPLTAPTWATVGGLCFSYYMISDEPKTGVYDGLTVALSDISDPDHIVMIDDIFVPNTDVEWIWREACVFIDDVPALRGHPLAVGIAALTDSVNVTGWYVDDVHLVFACGAEVP